MTTQTTVKWDNSAAFPDLDAWIPADIIGDALLLKITTPAGRVEGDAPSARLAYVKDNGTAEYTPEGEEIAASEIPLGQLVVKTRKIAALTQISNEALEYGEIASQLADSMKRAVVAKADRALLSETNPETPGLAELEGITDGGEITNTLDPLVNTIAQVAANGGTPGALVMGYDAWACLLTIKLADGEPLISPDVANSPTPMLYGLPVLLNAQAKANTILVIDPNEIFSAYGPVKTGRTSDRYFENDATGIRVTFRMGFGVARPERLGKITTNPDA